MPARRWSGLLLLLGVMAALALVSNRSARDNANLLTGLVCDRHGPLAGARVRFKGTPGEVLTNAEGHFQLARRPTSSQRVTASKEGYLIAGVPADSLPLSLQLSPLPSQDYEAYAWVDATPNPRQPGNCGNCHGEIYREWSASGHARSVTGRHFRNLYDGTDWHGNPGVGWSLLAEHPDGAGVCAACHAPTVASFTDPAFTDLREARGVAAQGVHCDYCHKVAGVDNGPLGLTHGRYNLKLLRPKEGQLFFGPLDDVDRQEDSFAPLYRQSRYCASCHEGTVFGVHVYGTYSEWLESPARKQGKECQTCHMTPTGTLTNIAPGRGGIERDPRTLANHRFFAGSRADMLRQCLKAEVTLTREGDAVRAAVEVSAHDVGHRVPTGFVDRNLLLIVEAVDAQGKAVSLRQGPTLSEIAGNEHAGRPGKVYAKLLKDFDDHSPAPFWRATKETVDTRLVPGRPDRAVLTFPATVERLRIRLLYRRFWQTVAETKGWPDNETTVVDRTVTVAEHLVTLSGCQPAPRATGFYRFKKSGD